MVNRLTIIFYKNKFFYYPIKPLNAFANLGAVDAFRCALSFARQAVFAGEKSAEKDETFESWVVERFGRRLFEIFFKTYSEKLWGIECDKLDADFAAQRIKKLSLAEVVKNAVKKGKGNKHKTLVDEFAYPHKGSGVVYERMAAAVESSGGGRIFYRTPVNRVVTEKQKAVGLEIGGGEFRAYDRIVSTMPLTHLVGRLPDAPAAIMDSARSLKFRNTILVYLKIDSTDLFADNWLYIHADDLQTGRITNFRNWSPQLYGDEQNSILALEYWCYDEDDLWRSSGEDLISLASAEIRKTGLIKDAAILDGFVHRVKNCYPVYSRGYREKLAPVENYLKTVENLSVIGRYGAFKYNNQDHSILMGILAAENIAQDARHNLWEINTDYEYQESATIDKTGLQKNALKAQSQTV